MHFISCKILYVHKPITNRIRNIVDISLVHCHGRSEFESRHRTLLVFFRFFFRFFIFINLFIYRYYTIIDFNEVDIRIYLPEKVIIHRGR